MESRIGSLAIRVRASAEGREGIPPAVEEFMRSVLARCESTLESRAPGRVLVMRRLDLSIRVSDEAPRLEGEVDSIAGEIAGTIDRWAAAAGETPSGDPELAVFESETVWRAAHLECFANGDRAESWRFDALEEDGEPIRTLLDAEREPLLRDVLSCLLRRGTLRSSLAALPTNLIEVLARTVGAFPVTRTPPGAADAALPDVVVASLLGLPPSTSLPLARIEIAVAAREALGPLASAAEVARIARAGLSRFLASQTGPEPREEGQHDRILTAENNCSIGQSEILSEFGGLFYLLSPAFELGLGEILWRVCLPEGVVLARAVAALVGVANQPDPAPALFGGVRSDEPLPVVVPEQQVEVSLALFSALIGALPRRRLADLPEMELRLVDTPNGRLLVAAGRGSPYPLLALCADSPEDMQTALDCFLTIWPRSAPVPCALRPLAELDRRGRIRPSQEVPAANGLLLAEGDSLPARALVTQATGTLGHLFAARLGVLTPFAPADLARRCFAIPARIELGEQSMKVCIPMGHLDLDVRRAGLDVDPGWVPWLGRRVTFRFEEFPKR